MKVLHVLHYNWPVFDGYVARTLGIVTAQRKVLNYEIGMAVSPYASHSRPEDRDLLPEGWGPDYQEEAFARRANGKPIGKRRGELPEIGLSPISKSDFTKQLRKLAHDFQPDLIHAHHPHFVGSPAYRIAREKRIPFVDEIRCFNGDFFLDERRPELRLAGHFYNFWEMRLARRADACVTIGDALAERMAVVGVEKAKTFTVRNSVNCDHFFPGNPPSNRPKGLHVGYATTFAEIENLEAAVEAACLVKEKLGRRPFTLTLAGHGAEWTKINELVSERGAGEFIKLPGFVTYSAMPDFYRSLDLFLIPRKPANVALHTTPLKPLEALACGIPLLSSSLPAMRELLAGRDDAQFIETTPQAMAEGILAFAENPWTGSGSITDRAWDREVLRYDKVYQSAFQHHVSRNK